MRVCIDLEKCYKSGECYYNHPEMFKMGEEGYPVVLISEIGTDAQGAELRQHAEEAAEVCPAVAISLQD